MLIILLGITLRTSECLSYYRESPYELVVAEKYRVWIVKMRGNFQALFIPIICFEIYKERWEGMYIENIQS